MQENQERWRQLCEQAAKEEDPAKLMELIVEINCLLRAKERRLKGDPSASDSASEL